MIFTTKMKQLVAVVLDRDAEKVTRELLNQSLLHFVNIRELSSEWESRIGRVEPQVSLAMLGEMRNRIESFLGMIKYRTANDRALDINKLVPIDIDSTRKMLDKIVEKLQSVRERQRMLQQEILKYEDIRRQLELFGDIGAGIQASSRYSFLNIQTGAVRNQVLNNFEQALNEIPSVSLHFGEEGNLVHILLITMKKDDSRVNGILSQFGWVDIDITGNLDGLKTDVNEDISTKLASFTREQEQLKTDSDTIIEQNKDTLMQLWENIRLNELYYKIQSYFSKTARTVLFSGWLPADKQKTLEKAIRKVTEGRCYLKWNNPEELTQEEQEKVKVPVKFQNPKFLAPFQMLVKNYSLPEYGTIEPTAFVAVAYLIMFGLMFGDACQGIVLMIIGLLGSFLYKGNSRNVRDLMKLVIWCGGAATAAGILFGSYFGYPWFEPVWFDYHSIVLNHIPNRGSVKSVYDILRITIYFGIAVISFGLILNWINLIIKKQWFQLIFHKSGLLGAWMYAAGVYTAFYFTGSQYKNLPAGNLLVWFFGVPALLFVLKPVLEFIIHKKHNPALRFTLMTPVDFLMEWIVEMLEVFSGYLANTLSFMRVAGLGIAHVSLMFAFSEIARMLNNGSAENFGFWSYLILVLGNILVIALEGLSAGIQSLRLNYYEFFSKYFRGSGEAYSPVSLRSHD